MGSRPAERVGSRYSSTMNRQTPKTQAPAIPATTTGAPRHHATQMPPPKSPHPITRMANKTPLSNSVDTQSGSRLTPSGFESYVETTDQREGSGYPARQRQAPDSRTCK